MMKHPVFPMPRASRRNRRAMALILTLAILTIISILVVSFLSVATLDRSATKSYAQSLRADQIAQGGLDQIVSQLQAEIADPGISTNSAFTVNATNNLYIPISATNATPQRTAAWATNLATLLSYSGTKLYTAGSGATDFSSASPTKNPSLNGRYISTSRWNSPQLTTATNGFPVPNWILMTRAGPQSVSSYNTNLANSTALNTTYVVGRYSYVVYDTSGLLDANVAGYPSSAATNAPGKGLLPWADLTQIASTISQTDIDNLVKWRNASTATGYATNVQWAATNNGFTRVANGDTCFLSRQELIRYAQTQNPDLTNALPYLTIFSREVNGPSWGPTSLNTGTTSGSSYASQEYATGAVNPRIPNPRVLVAFTRNNGLPAVVGEPLVKYRFPLDKLALLEKMTGPGTSALTASDITDIQKYFGLDCNGDSNGPSYRHWTYPTASTTYKHGVLSGASGIMNLNDVALQNREPDFFELLQAGMLAGSLGVPGKTNGNPNPGRGDEQPANSNGHTGFVDPDDSQTLQIMRTGANIINQWLTEDFPVTIDLSLPGSPTISVYGIADLPYPFAAYLNIYGANQKAPPFNFYIYFELWNPHQQNAGASSANYPTQFRVSPVYYASGTNDRDAFLAGFSASVPSITPSGTTSKNGVWFWSGTQDLITAPQYLGDPADPLQITFTAGPAQYREPTLISGTTVGAPFPLNTIACIVPNPLLSFPATNEPANDYGDTGSGVKFPSDLTTLKNLEIKVYMTIGMRFQYQDAGSNWRTYATFMGIDDSNNGAFAAAGTGYYLDGILGISGSASLDALSFVKCDPRTFRLGAGLNTAGGSTPSANTALSTSSGTMNNPVNGSQTFGASSTGVGSATPYRLDMWAVNNNSVTIPTPKSTSSSYYSDVDGVQRWGDAANSYSKGPTSPLFAGDTFNRPVMLNRPFQSVGELGYAFRDAPWKTIDFFSANSADSALLDLFTLSDAPVLAGRVNPNTPYPAVLSALVSGAAQSTTGGTNVTSTASAANALSIGQAIQNVTSNTPFVNRADLVNRFMTNTVIINAASGIKTQEEAAVRAIAESSNTRTWNFMIDIIAQAGKYPSTASTLDNFSVESERRYWLHVAIDRYTGQVVDKELEVVNE